MNLLAFSNVRSSCRGIVAVIFSFSFFIAQANNIQVSQASLFGQDTTAGYTNIQFNLTWDNSWRYNLKSGINNWDAAWVFVKFRVGAADPVLTNASSSGNIVTVTSTADLRVGMPVTKLSGTGTISSGSVITAITSSTTFTISGSVPGLTAATLHCGRIWEHARLGNAGHSPGSGLQADLGLRSPASTWHAATNPVVGVHLYRDAVGQGTVNNNIQLRWNYADNGLTRLAMVDIQVYAIEMVHVPQGSFYVGSGGGGTAEFYSDNLASPYLINSEGAVTIGSSSSNLYYPAGASAGDQSGPIPAAFPKGYNAYYCMKYELSQQQYVDFLNTLTRIQQANRVSAVTTNHFAGTTDAHSSPQNRNGVRVMSDLAATSPRMYGCDLNVNSTAAEAADGQCIPMNFLAWMDAAAYLDWAGLRPMTELEYEKVARGNLYPVAREYAWGDTTLAAAAYTLSNEGTLNESVGGNYATGSGNALYATTSSAVSGPMRVGSLSTLSATRRLAGASFWGILDLSGGVSEQVVTLGNATGRTYTGTHGSGEISSDGNASDNAFWPGYSGSEVTGATGSGFRGGAWSDDQSAIRVSDRSSATLGNPNRTSSAGIRGVRTAACSNGVSMPAEITITEGLVGSVPNSIITASTTLDGYSGVYIWSLSKDWKILSGQGNDTIKILTGNDITELRVAATNGCGSGPERSARLVSNVLATGGDSVTSYIADGTNGENGKKYIVHSFYTSGSQTFQPLVPLTTVDYLIVAGGGGGGGLGSGDEGQGGGGAGGLLCSFTTPTGGSGTLSLSATAYPIVVGAGGAQNVKGTNSSAFGLTAEGGGLGGNMGAGGAGGSGGGGAGKGGQKPGGVGNAGPPRQGYDGGIGLWSPNTSGGGGGAGGAGGTNSVGGVGLSYSITGTLHTYAQGGNGGTTTQGAASTTKGGGGGGGKSGWNSPATAGQTGVVIIRYKADNN